MSYPVFRSREREDGSRYSYPIENSQYPGRTLHVQEVPQREEPKKYKVIFLFEDFDDPHAMDMMEEYEIYARSSLEAMMKALSEKKNPNDPAHVIMLDPSLKQVASSIASGAHKVGAKAVSAMRTAGTRAVSAAKGAGARIGTGVKAAVGGIGQRVKQEMYNRALMHREEELAKEIGVKIPGVKTEEEKREEIHEKAVSSLGALADVIGKVGDDYDADYLEFEDLPLSPEAHIARLSRSNPPPWDVTIFPVNAEDPEEEGMLRLIPDYDALVNQVYNPDYTIRSEASMLLATYYPDEYQDWMEGIELI